MYIITGIMYMIYITYIQYIVCLLYIIRLSEELKKINPSK